MSCFCSPRMEQQIVAYPHFGASILRGVGSPQFLNEHGTQVLNREQGGRAEKESQGCCVCKVETGSLRKERGVNLHWIRKHRIRR